MTTNNREHSFSSATTLDNHFLLNVCCNFWHMKFTKVCYCWNDLAGHWKSSITALFDRSYSAVTSFFFMYYHLWIRSYDREWPSATFQFECKSWSNGSPITSFGCYLVCMTRSICNIFWDIAILDLTGLTYEMTFRPTGHSKSVAMILLMLLPISVLS